MVDNMLGVIDVHVKLIEINFTFDHVMYITLLERLCRYEWTGPSIKFDLNLQKLILIIWCIY